MDGRPARAAPATRGPRPDPEHLFKTLANDPDSFVLGRKNALPAREREIVILRIGFLCRSGYEWTQQVGIGTHVGLTADELPNGG